MIKTRKAWLQAAPADHPDRPLQLANLGIALRMRFERTGALADLVAAIDLGRAAVDATPDGHPNRFLYLTNLGLARQSRFGHTRVLADQDAAIDDLQAAVDAVPDGHPEQPLVLFNLGNAQRVRFQRTGALADVNAAIGNLRAAMAATPDGHPYRTVELAYLGIALEARFERTGARADLDAAIGDLRAAVAATPDGHPDRAMYLSSLEIARLARFERTGARADLDAAIDAGQGAVAVTPADHPYRAKYLSNLGIAWYLRFGRSGVLADLDAALDNLQAAVDAGPAGQPERAAWLSNLGEAHRVRFGRTGALEDLDAAVDSCRAAAAATPVDDPRRAAYLSNLAIALVYRSDRTDGPADLDAAIGNFETVLAATPADHPDRARRLSNSGNARRIRFARAGDQADRAEALSAFAQAAGAGSAAPSTRIMAACAAAEMAERSESARAAELLELAVRLLPELAPRYLRRGDQQYALRRFSGLAGDAAALVLAPAGSGPADGHTAERALALLEAGRAVLLSQALDTRTDLTDLRQQHPGLAAQFTELREQLDQPVDDAAWASLPPAETGTGSLAGRLGDRRRLAAQFAAVLEEIRSLEGFMSFGQPPTADELLSGVGQGPVVTFSISGYRSDALLLTADGVTSLPLPGLGWDALADQISSFYQALQTTADHRAPPRQRLAAQATLSGVLEWLWDSAAGPIPHALGHDDQPPPDRAWPRVWWAPGGLLGRLPVHAAGYHSDPPGPDRRAVMDRVVSSYTPTIRALRYARQHLSTSGAVHRSLIVAMPVTPGLPDGGKLANVRAEVDRIRGQLPDPVLLIEPGPADTPGGSSGVSTRASVIAQLPGCAIVHFACHGATDAADPSQSLLLLDDHDRNPLTVASLAPVNLADAQLAYLSACRTAVMSGTDLLDEAIHLTTAFQLAGFPCVVGTLWEISDQHAVGVAGSFYAALRDREGVLEVSVAARALHHAVRELRDQYPKVPSLWASYLHVGALSSRTAGR